MTALDGELRALEQATREVVHLLEAVRELIGNGPPDDEEGFAAYDRACTLLFIADRQAEQAHLRVATVRHMVGEASGEAVSK